MAGAWKPSPLDLWARASEFMNFKRNPWPYAIIAWFVIFASAMAAWITFATRQNMDLVRTDYYEAEIRYQRQLDCLNRTAALRPKVAIHYSAATREIIVKLPAEHATSRPAGRIHFYRPSEAALDFEVPLAIDAQGRQRIDGRNLRAGQWKVSVGWTAAGQDYSFEQTVVAEHAGVATDQSDLAAAKSTQD